MKLAYRLAVTASILLVSLLTRSPVAAGELVTIDTRPGVTQSFMLLEPEGRPAGVILVFPGHEGVVKFSQSGGHMGAEIERGGFTASEETRQAYREQGLVVALLAPPSDRQEGMDTAFRSSREHVTDIGRVIDYLGKRYRQTPYLHGHCRSSFSPASVATQLGDRHIAGLILSSPRSRGRHGSVTDYARGAIDIPVLLVQHAADPCKGTPYSNLETVRQFYETASPQVDVIVVTGGDTASTGPGSCQNGAHSFLGLQQETATAIANWIQGKDFRDRIHD